jgi:formate dehydrogenase maturation protein FdhE
MPPAPEAVALGLDHAMSPLNRYTWTPDPAFHRITARLVSELAGCAKPASTEASRRMVASADDRMLDQWATDMLAAEAPADAVGSAVFVTAALQVHLPALASSLDADALKPIGHGACPCSAPVASAVVGWSGCARYALPVLLAVRCGLELHPNQVRRLRHHQGHRLLRLRWRERPRQSRDLRQLRRLSESLPAT